jgi:hypothetical protein
VTELPPLPPARIDIEQILSAVQARVWPQIGNGRHFADPSG